MSTFETRLRLRFFARRVLLTRLGVRADNIEGGSVLHLVLALRGGAR